MNTTKETKEYIEPLNFKGTKGEWTILEHHIFDVPIIASTDRVNSTSFRNKYNMVCQMTEIRGDAFTDNSGSSKANTILLSQSKEMAKTIEDLITRMDKCRNILQTSDDHKGFWGVLDTEKAKEVLNKALNISQ